MRFPLLLAFVKTFATSLRFVVSKNGWFGLHQKVFTFAFTLFELYVDKKVWRASTTSALLSAPAGTQVTCIVRVSTFAL